MPRDRNRPIWDLAKRGNPNAQATARRATSFATLDILRGIAAISVVILHFRPFFAPIRAYGGYLAVDLFFLISGFVLAHAYDSKLRRGMTAIVFMRARIVRLLPFYGVGLLSGLALLAYHGRHQDMGDIITISGVLSLLLIPTPPIGFPYDPLFPANLVFWTLHFEILVNLAYAATIRWQNATRLWILVGVAATILAVSACVRGNLNGGAFWPEWYLAMARTIFSFFAGVLISRISLPRTMPGSRLPEIGSVLIVIAALFWRVPTEARGVADAALVLVILPAALFMATRNPPGTPGPLDDFLGEISYPIYVLQMPIFSAFIIVAERLSPLALQTSAPWLGIGTLMILAAASWIMATRVDRPLRRWLGNQACSE